MSDLNVTSTIVSFSNAPHMLENGWKFIAISSAPLDNRVLLVKGGYQELESNGRQRRMRPKRGGPPQQQPPALVPPGPKHPPMPKQAQQAQTQAVERAERKVPVPSETPAPEAVLETPAESKPSKTIKAVKFTKVSKPKKRRFGR